MNITSKEVANFYKEASKKLAEMVLDLNDLQAQADCNSRSLSDDAEPAFAMQESIEKLAVALAWSVSYGLSYEKDTNKKENKQQ